MMPHANAPTVAIPSRRRHLAVLGLVAAALLTTATSPASAKTSYAFGSDDHGVQWALIGPDGDVSSSTWSDESRRVIDRLRARQRQLLWLRVEERDYVVTDRAALEEVEAVVRPTIELGTQQGQLGRQQGELGRKQGRLGREQGRVGALQGRLSARLARAGDGAESRSRRAEIRRQMDELEEMQRELAEAQRPLALRQQELGRRQQALGERQREASAESARAMERLAAKWVSDGRARPLGD